MRRARVVSGLLCAGLGLGAVALSSAPAAAQGAQRVGWWNSLTVGGVAAPAPGSVDGGLRVQASPSSVVAYGALLYGVPASGTGTLTLQIASSSGTVTLEACPTKDATWKAGGDQSSSDEPAYDCSTTFTGTVAADGKSVTFPVNLSPASTPGVLSLAILPDLSGAATDGVNTPFTADISPPSATSLTVAGTSGGDGSSVLPAPAGPRGFTPAGGGDGGGAGSLGGQPLGVPLPADAGSVPDIAPQVAAPNAPAPAVAGAAPTTNGAAVRPLASTSGGRRTIAAILGGLAAFAALVTWGLGYGLLGGRVVPLSVPLPVAPRPRQ